MKEITIYQANNPPIILTDNDESQISDFTQKISAILKAGNVTILEMESGNVIIRPHKIDSVHIRNVTPLDYVTEPVEETVIPETVVGKSQPPIEEEDYITDGD